MSPQQLSDDIKQAQVTFNQQNNLPDDHWNAPPPYFDYDVKILNPDGSDGGFRAPKDCASANVGAPAISDVLADQGYTASIVFYWSQGYPMQTFSESRPVPWLLTADRKKWANAGKCLEHFTHGYSSEPGNPYSPAIAAEAEFVDFPAGITLLNPDGTPVS